MNSINLTGKPADIASSAYRYEANRSIKQNDPESWILMMDYAKQPFEKPANPDAPEIKNVLCAYIWEEVRPVERVELVWPDGKPHNVAVIYNDASGDGIHTWWNKQSPFKEAGEPQVSKDGRTVIYTMPCQTFGILVVSKDTGKKIVPEVHVFGKSTWKQTQIEIEWGFDPAMKKKLYDGEISTYDGVLTELQPIGQVTCKSSGWKSEPVEGRRGIRLNLAYIGKTAHHKVWPNDSEESDVIRTLVTVKTKNGGFTFRASDLEEEPIYAPEYGFYVRKVDSQPEATDFVTALKAKNLKTVREQVRELPEQTWEGAVKAMWPTLQLPPIPTPSYKPAMSIDVPSKELVAQWNLSAEMLLKHSVKDVKGTYRFCDFPFALLASENFLIMRALDLLGMTQAAQDGLDQWTELPTNLPKPMGWFSDGNGVMSHAKDYVPGWGSGGFPEDVGGGMDSPHAMGPGAIGYELAEHYKLTGDKTWLKKHAARLIANADWIIRQQRLLAQNIPGGERLWCGGLLPPHQVTPDSGGMLTQFYESEAYYWSAVRELAEILKDVDASAAKELAAKAAAYGKDLKSAVEKSILLSPVTLVRDGTYRSFIPFACYVRGFASEGWNWRRPGSFNHVNGMYWDTVQSAAPLISPAGLLPVNDPRVQGFLDVLEDRLLSENARLEVRTPGYKSQKDWFAHSGWQYQCGLERQANIHMAGDDPSCFIRTTLNQYAVDLQPGEGYSFREHTVAGPMDKSFELSAFLERLRDALVYEVGSDLWVCRAAPRVWFADGEKISVGDSPTLFGPVSYRVSSSLSQGLVSVDLKAKWRKAPTSLVVRVRHPQGLSMKSVTVDGAVLKKIDRKREVVILTGCSDKVSLKVHF